MPVWRYDPLWRALAGMLFAIGLSVAAGSMRGQSAAVVDRAYLELGVLLFPGPSAAMR